MLETIIILKAIVSIVLLMLILNNLLALFILANYKKWELITVHVVEYRIEYSMEAGTVGGLYNEYYYPNIIFSYINKKGQKILQYDLGIKKQLYFCSKKDTVENKYQKWNSDGNEGFLCPFIDKCILDIDVEKNSIKKIYFQLVFYFILLIILVIL